MSSSTPISAFALPLRHGRQDGRRDRAPAAGQRSHPAFDDIDRLLRAIAENDPQYRNHTIRHSGSVAVALDSITRWLDQAETRFAELTKRNARTEQLVIQVAALVATQLKDGSEAKSLSEKALNTVCHLERNAADKQKSDDRRRVALAVILERLTGAMLRLDREIARLEKRIAERPDTQAQNIHGLAADLGAHIKNTAQEAQNTRDYFDLTTSRIEAFADELREIREIYKTVNARQSCASLSPPPQVEREKAVADPSLVNFSTEENSLQMRSGLIAAARRANRSETEAEHETIPRPGRFFLRALETGKR